MEDIYRDLQRVYLGKAHEVAPHRLKKLQEERFVVFVKAEHPDYKSRYCLTEGGDMLREKLHKDGVRDTSLCTLGDLLRAKGKQFP